jgi:hypothetical protein
LFVVPISRKEDLFETIKEKAGEKRTIFEARAR